MLKWFSHLWHTLKQPFAELDHAHRQIQQTIKQHGLNGKIGVIGVLVSAITIPIMAISLFAFWFGPSITVTPPEALDPIREAGCAFLLNKWFWASSFLSCLGLQFLGYYLHPEAQLRRKLGREAVWAYKRQNEWPWL